MAVGRVPSPPLLHIGDNVGGFAGNLSVFPSLAKVWSKMMDNYEKFQERILKLKPDVEGVLELKIENIRKYINESRATLRQWGEEAGFDFGVGQGLIGYKEAK